MKPTKRVLDAQNKEIPIIGCAEIGIETPGGNFAEEFLIFQSNGNLKFNVLLGMNVLKNTVINFPEKRITFHIGEGKVKTQQTPGIKIQTDSFTHGVKRDTINILEENEQCKREKRKTFNIHLREKIMLPANSVNVRNCKITCEDTPYEKTC